MMNMLKKRIVNIEETKRLPVLLLALSILFTLFFRPAVAFLFFLAASIVFMVYLNKPMQKLTMRRMFFIGLILTCIGYLWNIFSQSIFGMIFGTSQALEIVFSIFKVLSFISSIAIVYMFTSDKCNDRRFYILTLICALSEPFIAGALALMNNSNLIVPNNQKELAILSLEELKNQFEEGIISDKEYAERKSEVLNRLNL